MTDLPDRQPAPPPPGEPEPADQARRRFFREFAGEVFQAAATVMNAAGALQRTSADAAAALLDPAATATRLEGVIGASSVPVGPTGFRTPFRWEGERLLVIDQRLLPQQLAEFEVRSAADAAYAIRQMIVRGAPAIGQVAAIGLALTANRLRGSRPFARLASIRGAGNGLINTRPTAVNLRWAVDRMIARYEAVGFTNEDGNLIADTLWAEAEAIVFQATEDHGRLATFGLEALPVVDDRPLELLTHCNTGPLACGQFGTALGVVQVAHHAGRPLHVWVDETRPYLQGARLTAWELAQAGVPHTLIADVAAASLLAAGRVDAVLVGADRVAANGDTANKLGTYPLAVLAARHGVPFLVCAPTSTLDPSTPDGAAIPIEERPPEEVTQLRGVPIAPDGTEAWNPAFDVTPAELVTAIVTDEGVLGPPFGTTIAGAVERARARRAAGPAIVLAEATAAEATAAPAPAAPATAAPPTAASPAPAAAPAAASPGAPDGEAADGPHPDSAPPPAGNGA